jgi:hypothetical protein
MGQPASPTAAEVRAVLAAFVAQNPARAGVEFEVFDDSPAGPRLTVRVSGGAGGAGGPGGAGENFTISTLAILEAVVRTFGTNPGWIAAAVPRRGRPAGGGS